MGPTFFATILLDLHSIIVDKLSCSKKIDVYIPLTIEGLLPTKRSQYGWS